jgi:hypothetical protein
MAAAASTGAKGWAAETGTPVARAAGWSRDTVRQRRIKKDRGEVNFFIGNSCEIWYNHDNYISLYQNAGWDATGKELTNL